MGFKDLKAFNLALLAKQGWRILENPRSLVPFLQAKLGKQPSYVWRSILAMKEIIVMGSLWNVGKGQRVHICEDMWIPRPNSFSVISPCTPQAEEELVAKLIDVDKKIWDGAKVRSIFLRQEADVVLGIPISNRLPKDSFIWAWTSNGKFIVKWKSSSFDNSKMKAIWKMIWKLNCPNEFKHFMWRACKNILPTKNHLKGCEFVKTVWSITKIKLPWLPDPMRDFLDLVWVVMESHSNIDWVSFAKTAWSLWNNRNSKVHGGQCRDEFKQDHHNLMRVLLVVPQPWAPPPQGWYKVNSDGAMFKEVGGCGIGVVIRNDRGQMMGSMSKGWSCLWDLGLKQIILGSDSLTMVNSLREHNLIPNSIHKVVEGTIINLRCFDAWEVSHTRRSSNFAAHVLARHAKSVTKSLIWVEDTPPIIANQVPHDVICMNSI
ncbi:hypothetical protein ACB092_05G096200 [Castanea dentata]